MIYGQRQPAIVVAKTRKTLFFQQPARGNEAYVNIKTAGWRTVVNRLQQSLEIQMPIMLFRLNNVPEDEAEEVRALLTEHGIEFYETHAGNWGVSTAAVWLRDESRLAEAKSLLETYQAERATRVREAYQQSKAEGQDRGLLDELKEHPVRLVVYVAVILAVLYLSTMPFFHWGR